MNVVVTGHQGFVGSHICQALLEQKHNITGVDDERMGQTLAPKGIALSVRATVGRGPLGHHLAKADVVVHCAAHADVSRNWTGGKLERDKLWSNNVDATRNLLEQLGPKTHVIFLSTCAVYGDSTIINGVVRRDTEHSWMRPQTSPYSASKLAGEQLIEAYSYAKNSLFHSFRLGCVVGAGYHHGHIADFVKSAREHGKIMGMNDGLTKKSFVYAKDVARAVASAIEMGDSLECGSYNLTAGDWCPRDTARVMGVEYVPIDKMHGWIGDPMAVAKNDKAVGAFWEPSAQGVEQGVRDALQTLGWDK
jgi:nucleoside-diphosphate-sugar epimerase